MKCNGLLDECRKRFITPEIERQVDICVEISNRIYVILDKKGMSQRDFANLLGKTEAEVSRMLSGTHNLTISTIAKIEVALGENIISAPKENYDAPIVFQPIVAEHVCKSSNNGRRKTLRYNKLLYQDYAQV